MVFTISIVLWLIFGVIQHLVFVYFSFERRYGRSLYFFEPMAVRIGVVTSADTLVHYETRDKQNPALHHAYCNGMHFTREYFRLPMVLLQTQLQGHVTVLNDYESLLLRKVDVRKPTPDFFFGFSFILHIATWL